MNDASIVTKKLIRRVLAARDQPRRVDVVSALMSEPHLDRLVDDRVLAIAGRLVLLGVPHCATARVAKEVRVLAELVAEVTRSAYRHLLADFLPRETPDRQRLARRHAPCDRAKENCRRIKRKRPR